jgi:hypothetical protein
MSQTDLPPIGKHYEELLRQMWDYQILTDEDYRNLWSLVAWCASPVEDVQEELRVDSKYRSHAGYYWRKFRLLREEVEDELEVLFYNFYSSVRSTKYGEESRVEDELPMPVLKNLQKSRKQDAPKGLFSKDLVKSHALQDPSYVQLAARVRWMKYFEGQLDELRTALTQRHACLCQWSNNNRVTQRNTGDT